MRVVLTGGPCSGKTTLINEFSRRHYHCLNEAALMVIQQLNKEVGVEQQETWRNAHPVSFQKRIDQLQVRLEQPSYDPSSLYILDRSRIDTLAYLEYRQENMSCFEDLNVQNYPLDCVLFLQPLGQYENGVETGRIESKEQALELSALIRKTYENRGYKIFLIDESPIQERFEQCRDIIDRLQSS